jgi:hypothetical protein
MPLVHIHYVITTVIPPLLIIYVVAALSQYLRIARQPVPPLVYLTSPSQLERILRTRRLTLREPIKAIRRALFLRCETRFERSILTLQRVDASTCAIEIPPHASAGFRPIFPAGPYTASRFFCGQFYLPSTTLNLDTGRFGRPAKLQVWLLYLMDVCLTLLVIMIVMLNARLGW